MKSRDIKPIPVGYMSVHMQAGVVLVLPTPVVHWLKERERAADQEAFAQDVLTPAAAPSSIGDARRRDIDVTNVAASELTTSPVEEGPLPGWHRVLQIADIERRFDNSQDAFRVLDRERLESRVRLCGHLIKKGPDRRIACNPQWRSELVELERTMPNFKGPIALIKNTLLLAQETGRAVRVPPMLLLGPAGVGKTYFSRRIAEVLGTSFNVLAFDQPSAGVGLRGNDKAWANAEAGMLFNLICLGEHANPVILLDELDKSGTVGSSSADPISQLLGALEPETARRTTDSAVEVTFDASLVTYIATANSTRGLSAPILSRFEVFVIERCRPADAVLLAGEVVRGVIQRLGLEGRVSLDRRALLLLAHHTPREMTRAVERAVAEALDNGATRIGEDDMWNACHPHSTQPSLH